MITGTSMYQRSYRTLVSSRPTAASLCLLQTITNTHDHGRGSDMRHDVEILMLTPDNLDDGLVLIKEYFSSFKADFRKYRAPKIMSFLDIFI